LKRLGATQSSRYRRPEDHEAGKAIDVDGGAEGVEDVTHERGRRFREALTKPRERGYELASGGDVIDLGVFRALRGYFDFPRRSSSSVMRR
jgi:hypothetical protein